MGVDQSDNELVTIEVIHRYVELLDKYFGSVSQKLQMFTNYTLNLTSKGATTDMVICVFNLGL